MGSHSKPKEAASLRIEVPAEREAWLPALLRRALCFARSVTSTDSERAVLWEKHVALGYSNYSLK